jgi:hypothetical protein
MMKLLFGVIALIAAAMVAGVYFSFNPVILIFVILGFGIYMVGRIGGPLLPEDAPSFGGRATAFTYAARITWPATRVAAARTPKKVTASDK